MGTILIHAGMPKTGSTAVQNFLRRNRHLLTSRGVTLAVASVTRNQAVSVDVHEYDAGDINSSELAQLLVHQPAANPTVMAELVHGLDRLADIHDMVVITSETLSQPFWRADSNVLCPLDELGRKHTIRVAYYVRPQHMALEAAWRQWGFRTGRPPSVYFYQYSKHLDYFHTLVSVRKTAQHIDFSIRPFRADLLDNGDVVVDFAFRFLCLDANSVVPSPDNEANVGLPLELINLLHSAPPGFLGDGPHDNRVFHIVKRLLNEVCTSTSENVEHGRRLLQEWCHERFEASNRQLIAELNWKTDTFVPSTGAIVESLSALDHLWRSRASPMELAAFFHLLQLKVQRARNDTGHNKVTAEHQQPRGHSDLDD